jgi:hypothetical protein
VKRRASIHAQTMGHAAFMSCNASGLTFVNQSVSRKHSQWWAMSALAIHFSRRM